MRKHLSYILSAVLALMPLYQITPALAQQLNPPSNQSFVGGVFVAKNYIYPGIAISPGTNIPSGAGTIRVQSASVRLPDGRTIVPFSAGGFNILGQPARLPAMPITVGAGATKETVTPTAVSGCFVGAPQNTCSITATFANAHGQGEIVTSGSLGVQEAVNDASFYSGGTVVVDGSWSFVGGTTAMLTAALVMPNTTIRDDRNGTPRYWAPTATGAYLAAPSPTFGGQAACDATHQTCSDATVAGSASWGGAIHTCVTYVDIMGNESPCSVDATWTSVASKAIDIASPPALTGAVGWIPYLSLSGGSYALAYQIPVTSTVCTMTTLETITPACAVANTTYNQAASTFGAGGLFTAGGAQITTFPVNTAMVYPVLATTAQTLAAQHPLTNSSVSYLYAPSDRVGACNPSSSNIVGLASASAISGSSATTVPNPIATWTIPSGCFNFIGAEFRVSGKFTYTDGGDTSTRVIVSWDSNVTNTASVPTPLCNILDTATGTAAAYNGTYTCTVRILTTGAGGTAMVNGYSTQNLAAGATTLVRNGADVAVAASAAIDLATNARIMVIFEGIGATNNPGAQGLEATLEVLN